MATVRETTFALLRELKLTTIFGNVGSTEEPFLQHFPSDFSYVLGLQEAAVIGIADGYAQVTGRPSLVNLHTSAGLGNALGNLMTTFTNKTPMIVTAGQQTREMLLLEPWLTNVDAEAAPKPWVKWSYEPRRAEDVPAAFMRAYALAVQPPQGPVFLSLPLDDWAKPSLGDVPVRDIGRRIAPDPERIVRFAKQISAAKNPVLVFGAAVDRANAWPAAIRLAEKLKAPVWAAPVADRAVFPEDHPQFCGNLPFAIGPLCARLAGHDLVLVVGAPVFSYYPYVAGDYLPAGAQLLHVTEDAGEAARAPVGDTLLSDAGLALAALADLVGAQSRSITPRPPHAPLAGDGPLTPSDVYTILARMRPADTAITEETPSSRRDFRRLVPFMQPASYFTTSSGGIGWSLPAAVGVALADRHMGRWRPVVAVIGDGSFQYTPQALWNAAQLKLPVVFLILNNGSYAILKSFAETQGYPGVPGFDLPGLDIVSIAKGYGCPAVRVTTKAEVEQAFAAAFAGDGPMLINAQVAEVIPKLV